MHVGLAVADVDRSYAFYREAAYFADPDGTVVAVAIRWA
jgi:hypothetical protein